MDWNEFNRELQNRVSDPGTRYCLGIVYERLLDLSKQVDMCAEICNQLANTVSGFVGLHEALDGQLQALNRHVKGDHAGVDLRSVPLTNDDE